MQVSLSQLSNSSQGLCSPTSCSISSAAVQLCPRLPRYATRTSTFKLHTKTTTCCCLGRCVHCHLADEFQLQGSILDTYQQDAHKSLEVTQQEISNNQERFMEIQALKGQTSAATSNSITKSKTLTEDPIHPNDPSPVAVLSSGQNGLSSWAPVE